MSVLWWRKREIYCGDILSNLGFVSLAQCKHRYYPTSHMFPQKHSLSPIPDVFMLQEWMEAVPRNFMYALSEEILPVLSVWPGSQTWNWCYFLSWQRLATGHRAQLLEGRNILLSSVAIPLPNDPNYGFWPPRELCLLNRGHTVGSQSVEAGKPAGGQLRSSPLTPCRGGGENREPRKLFRRFSKLHLAECTGKEPLIRKSFAVRLGSYFYCSTSM